MKFSKILKKIDMEKNEGIWVAFILAMVILTVCVKDLIFVFVGAFLCLLTMLFELFDSVPATPEEEKNQTKDLLWLVVTFIFLFIVIIRYYWH